MATAQKTKVGKSSSTNKIRETDNFPYLKTVEQMSQISGIGENKLRELMENREIEYIQNGNRRLLADQAIWDWYERAKICCKEVDNRGDSDEAS